MPRADFHAAEHPEMILEAVQPGEEHDARLVVLGRRLEDASRERHGRVEDGVVAGTVALRQAVHRRGRRRCDRVEDAEQRMRMVLAVALDQVGVVEVVARVHLHAGREEGAHLLLVGAVRAGRS